MANYSTTWNETTPVGTEAKSLGDNRIREVKSQLRERLASQHSDITGSTGDAYMTHLAGKSTILFVGTTSEITALTSIVGATSAQCCLAFDTTLGVLKYYNGSVWTTLPFDWDNFWGAGDSTHTHLSPSEGGFLSNIVVQTVNTTNGEVSIGTTVIPNDDTIPQITEGDEYMTLAITPKDATNKLLIDVIFNASSNNTTSLTMALFQDATANALAATSAGYITNNGIYQLILKHYMTTGTTSETTFRLRAGSGEAGTTTFNGLASSRKFGGILASSITITEIGTNA